MGWYKVTDTIHHTDEVVIHLTIDGEELETTPEHPFYVEGEGWVDAEDLQVGDDIRNADGEIGEVEAIESEQISQEMYNLTVDEAHTFFVGDGQWLVHNCGYIDLFHGTSRSGADNIRNIGIDLNYSKPRRDFGRGFYTTTDYAQAAKWANPPGRPGEVLHFKVSIDEFRSLNNYTFRGTSRNWLEFVINNRLQQPIPKNFSAYDTISGTMLLKSNDFFRYTASMDDYNLGRMSYEMDHYLLSTEILNAGGQQTAWYSPTAIELLTEGLVR